MRKLATYAALLVWSAICLFPLYWVLATSLKGPLNIVSGPYYLPFVDYTPSTESWTYILSNSGGSVLWRYLNSVVIGVISTTATVTIGAFTIYGLTRFPGAMPRASEMLLSGILATRILPPTVVVLPIYLMAQHTHTLDTRFALIFTYTAVNLPVAVWLLRPVLGTAATDLEQAAQLDGASRFRILFQITLPMAAPGLAATGLLVFILCWNEYLFAVYLAANEAMTMPPFLAAQMSVREQQAGSDAEEWSRLAVAILIMVIPPILLAGFMQRFLSRVALWTR